MSNEDIVRALVKKYAPTYNVVFAVNEDAHGHRIHTGFKAITIPEKHQMNYNKWLIANISPTFAKIIAIHEIGHAVIGRGHDWHSAEWGTKVEEILKAEGLGVYASRRYYRDSSFGLRGPVDNRW